MYYIYRYTNLLNGKVYVGQTVDLKRRQRQHRTLNKSHKNSCIYHAIKKYGIANFHFDIINQTDSRDIANGLETRAIEENNSMVPNGYNLVKYGIVGQVSDITRKRMSQSSIAFGHYPKNKSSIYRGIRKRKNKHGISIVLSLLIDDKYISRTCNSEESAAALYDRCILFMYGEGVKLNFEHLRQTYLSENLETYYNNFITNRSLTVNQYPNIYFNKVVNLWAIRCGYIKYPEKIEMKMFKTEKEAAEAFDCLTLYFNMKRSLNFPTKTYTADFVNDTVEGFKKSASKSSKYKGVKRHTQSGKWVAFYAQKHLGLFLSEKEAYNARKTYEELLQNNKR
jgi:group I intron endonuclease